MLSYFIAGSALGLSAGFAPGPLFALVISQTLQHGLKEGIKTAFAPLLSDIPIIFLTTFLLANVYTVKPLLGMVSIAGGMFLAYLAYENFQINPANRMAQKDRMNSVSKAVTVNLLNPHPYLFWFTVGSPMLLSAYAQDAMAAVGFGFSFYLCLVGAKVVLALIVHQSKTFFTGHAYIYLMKSLGLVLLIFAGILFREGLTLLLE